MKSRVKKNILQTNMSYLCSQSKHWSSGSFCTWYNAKGIKSSYKTPQNSLYSLDSFATTSQTSSNILSILTKMLDLAHITRVKFNLCVCVCAVTPAMTKAHSSNENAGGVVHRCWVLQHVFNCAAFTEIKQTLQSACDEWAVIELKLLFGGSLMRPKTSYIFKVE